MDGCRRQGTQVRGTDKVREHMEKGRVEWDEGVIISGDLEKLLLWPPGVTWKLCQVIDKWKISCV